MNAGSKRKAIFEAENHERRIKKIKRKRKSIVGVHRQIPSFPATANNTEAHTSTICMWNMHEWWQCPMDCLEYLMKMLNWWKLFKPLDHQVWWAKNEEKTDKAEHVLMEFQQNRTNTTHLRREQQEHTHTHPFCRCCSEKKEKKSKQNYVYASAEHVCNFKTFTCP